MAGERSGDLILAQHTFAFVQDGSTGQIDVIVGPTKTALQETDKPVVFDDRTKKFVKVLTTAEAIQPSVIATEGQYIVLYNPAKSDQKKHPIKGKNSEQIELSIGNKVNVMGPKIFALYPGQYVKTINGHQLKSNEYLVIRVYNEEAAKANIDQAVVKLTNNEQNPQNTKKNLIETKDIENGKLFIIKGTEVSFYIPPTGIEVVRDEAAGNYVRNAVTLERLEYCILLDQNGNKRYKKGPDVVFPEPTEEFVMQKDKNSNKFRAIELNDNMGIYIKVIADYEEDNKEFKAGDEMFITGKEMKIYYPRPEHAIIKYGEQTIHYAIAIPAGEGRYVLNKVTGAVEMVKGPKMFLANPMKEVIVKRVLDTKTINLLYPGNTEALTYNQSLQDMLDTFEENEQSIHSSTNGGRYLSASLGLTGNSGGAGNIGYSSTEQPSGRSKTASFNRGTSFTKPRMITLDTKYEGVVTLNIWPGFAVQIIKKNGEREVVNGPKAVLMEYDETLEVLSLSTGKPKNDDHVIKTVYLQTANNIVSDEIIAETKDSVNVSVRVSYRVNFKEESKTKWFSVPNYVKLLTQHLRSIVRNGIKKNTIEEFNSSATDIIRNIILGESKEGKREGKLFEENGMHVYDVEVLNIVIGDSSISKLLKDAQYNTVEKNLSLAKEQKNAEYTKRIEELKRERLVEESKTEAQRQLAGLERIAAEAKQRLEALLSEKNQQEVLDFIAEAKNKREREHNDVTVEFVTKQTELEIRKVKERMEAVSPKMIEAITALQTVAMSEVLAKNLRSQTSGLHGIFPEGGAKGLLETIKGTPLEKSFSELFQGQKITTPNG